MEIPYGDFFDDMVQYLRSDVKYVQLVFFYDLCLCDRHYTGTQ